jgi:hypothetical protein
MMTVTLDKKQIHLGWQAAASILVIGIPFLVGLGIGANKFFTKQESMYNAVIEIKKDNADNKKAIAKTRSDLDSLIRIGKPLITANTQEHYYIQIKRDGKTYWKEAPSVN